MMVILLLSLPRPSWEMFTFEIVFCSINSINIEEKRIFHFFADFCCWIKGSHPINADAAPRWLDNPGDGSDQAMELAQNWADLFFVIVLFFYQWDRLGGSYILSGLMQ